MRRVSQNTVATSSTAAATLGSRALTSSTGVPRARLVNITAQYGPGDFCIRTSPEKRGTSQSPAARISRAVWATQQSIGSK
jgi:hypothetical protein